MLKIAVYANSLNEAAFVNRWAASLTGADQVLVLDTGSTDNTVQLLRDCGVTVGFASINPFRFDDARNTALNLLAPDIDVAIQLDLDEVLVPGWRGFIEEVWKQDTTRLRYKYIWSWTSEGKPDKLFFADKISGRHTHRWKNPVHEVLIPTVPEVTAVCSNVLIEHHPDPDKSKAYYLNLLELAVREDPLNDRSSHYLGREYFFHKLYEKAISEFRRHLSLPTARWGAERASSFRYGAKCFEALGVPLGAYTWYVNATLEDPQSREACVDLAAFLLREQDWHGVIYFTHKALSIPPEQSSYINERYALEEGPFDLAAVAYHNIGDQQKALAYVEKALELNPNDSRIQQNKLWIDGKHAL